MEEKKLFTEKFNSLSKKNKFLILAAAAVFVIGAGAGLIWSLTFRGADRPAEVTVITEEINEPEEKICEASRRLDGVCVKSGKENLPIFTYMIENASDSRPPTNLSKANMVFEAIAEGGITRFLAVYDSDQDLNRVSPVRSARTYFLDWASEFQGLYIHIGGSPESLELVYERPIYDVNEFAYGSYFWRTNDKVAPHNVCTSTDLMRKLIEFKKWEIKPNYESWQFKKEAELTSRPESQEIYIDYNSDYYSVKWQYDKENNDYTRFQGGTIHKDADGSVIKVKNIAVMYSKSYVIPGDDKFRRYTQTVGEGKAYVFLDGQVIEGQWQRPDLESRTRFYDAQGNEVEFNQGVTWVQALPNDYPLPTY